MNLPPALADHGQLAAFRTALATWFNTHQRPMPWRSAPSLYRTVVSEFMLQQTRVDTVRPYFERWTNRWSDFHVLAHATESDVLKAWEGLGYYSRARNLRRLAIAVTAMPSPPNTARDWAQLPGIGAYTAAAIASIACHEAVAVVDGNVVRVLARIFADTRLFKDNSSAAKAFADAAQCLLDPAAPGTHNQAVMELGALVCLPRAPRCGECPVQPFCAAAAAQTPENFPRFALRKTEKISVVRLLCVHRERILLFRHSTKARRLAEIYELPDARLFPQFSADSSEPIAVRRRAISNQQITETIRRATPPFPKPTAPNNGTLEWVALTKLPAIALSGPHRKWLTSIQNSKDSPFPRKPTAN